MVSLIQMERFIILMMADTNKHQNNKAHQKALLMWLKHKTKVVYHTHILTSNKKL